jgi:aldose 1-epimerase
VLGYARAREYCGNKHYLGACVGRYANRIAHACFDLCGVRYDLDRNDGRHLLHGGRSGFHTRIWDVVALVEDEEMAQVTFAITSPDGEMGFPGHLHARVSYRLEEFGRLSVLYEGETNAPTVLNMTNHSYFNLAGEGSGDIASHELAIAADSFLPTDADLIPVGPERNVAGSAFDFRLGRAIGDGLAGNDDQLSTAGGYDHNFCLAGQNGGLRPVARLRDPCSGREMQIITDQPGLQLYTGNFLDGSSGRGAVRHTKWSGLCLETQAYPNSPNQPTYPSTVLRPGRIYRSRTDYVFST